MFQWELFKANPDNIHSDFERLCYLLFCKEHNKHYGVMRYKNQIATECDPIEHDGKYIAFQAKFYETKLSDHKNDFIKMLDNVHKCYPQLTHLIIYTNQDLTQGRGGGKTKFEQEINKKAEEYSITIEWRTNESYFKSLDMIENQHIIDYFIKPERRQAIEGLQDKTKNYLQRISTSIFIGDQEMRINRNDKQEEIKKWILDENSQGIFLVSGEGGVGKTSIVKVVLEQLQEQLPLFVFNSSDFSRANYPDDLFPKNLSRQQFNDFHKDYSNKIFVVDSAEKILDLEDFSVFEDCIKYLLDEKWKVLLIARQSSFCNIGHFYLIQNTIKEEIEIEKISVENLKELAIQYNFKLPDSSQTHLIHLLCNPMYLSLFLKNSNKQTSYGSFKKEIFSYLVPEKYHQNVLDAVIEKAKNGSFFISSSNQEMLKTLEGKGTIYKDNNDCYVFSHDIYEEVILYRAINSYYHTKNSLEFFDCLGSSHRIKKVFKDWFIDNSDQQKKDIAKKILDSSDVDLHWKNEVIIAILQSQYSKNFFDDYSKKILTDFNLFVQICRMLLIACRTYDKDQSFDIEIDDANFLRIFNAPQGEGWENFIVFLWENKNELREEYISHIIRVFNFWNSKNKDTTITEKASLLTLEWIREDKIPHSQCENARQIIINGCNSIKQELDEIFEQLLNGTLERRGEFGFLVDCILGDFFKSFSLVTYFPDYCIEFAKKEWIKKKQFEDPLLHDFSCGINSEDLFGLSLNRQYFPDSAYQTPLYRLLMIDWKKGLSFAVEFINQSVLYCHSLKDKDNDYYFSEVELYYSTDQHKKILHSQALWQMYRGYPTPTMPHLLCSLHMALEKFLLDKKDDSEILKMLEFLLRETETSSIVAIVSSVVSAIPEKAYPIALLLFKTLDFFYSDSLRCIYEQNLAFSYKMGYGLNSDNDIFIRERLQTLKEEHRKKRLGDLCLTYQLFYTNQITEIEANIRRNDIWAILDEHFKHLSSTTNMSELDKKKYQSLLISDSRKCEQSIQKLNETTIQIGFEIKEEHKISDTQDIQEEVSKINENYKFQAWSQARLEDKKEEYEKYTDLENNCSLVVQKINELWDDLCRGNSRSPLSFFDKSTLVSLAIVLYKDFGEKISIEDKQKCQNIILSFAQMIFEREYHYSLKDGVSEAIQFLHIFDFDENIQSILLASLKRFEIIHNEESHFYDFAILAIKNLPQEHKQRMLVVFIEEISNQKINTFSNASHFIQDMNISQENVILKMLTITALDNDLKDLFNAIVDKRGTHIFQKTRLDYEENFFIDNLAKLVFNQVDIPQAKVLAEKINDHFSLGDGMIAFLEQIIYLQDQKQKYNKFWSIWDIFFENVTQSVKDCNAKDEQKTQLIRVYTMVGNRYRDFWTDENEEWHTIEDRDWAFYKEISEKIGNHPTTLYCVVKILATVGMRFGDRGIFWIEKMINTHRQYANPTIPVTSLENFLYKYLTRKKFGIQQDKEQVQTTSNILDSMIENGSAFGYFMRENIL